LHHFAYGEHGLFGGAPLAEPGRAREGAWHPQAWQAWEYDAEGQLAALDDAWRDKKRYRYDALSRLACVTATGEAEAVHYDPAGNLLATASSLSRVQAWKASGIACCALRWPRERIVRWSSATTATAIGWLEPCRCRRSRN